jgi:hypothetical protein
MCAGSGEFGQNEIDCEGGILYIYLRESQADVATMDPPWTETK